MFSKLVACSLWAVAALGSAVGLAEPHDDEAGADGASVVDSQTGSVRQDDGSRYVNAGERGGPAGSGKTQQDRERAADNHPWMRMVRGNENFFFPVFRDMISARIAQLESLDKASISPRELARLHQLRGQAEGATTAQEKYNLMRTVHMENLVIGRTGSGANDRSWSTYLSNELERRNSKNKN